MRAMQAAPVAAIEAPVRRGTSSRVTTIAVVIVTGVLILAAAYLSDRSNTVAGSGGVTSVTVTGTAIGAAPVVGQPAPDFSATTLDGKQVRLSDFLGHPVWLTFGASWCQPCRAENPDIESTYQRYGARGLVVLQVYMSEDTATVVDYTTRVGLTYTRIPDPDEGLSAEYRILGIPSHFFIDPSGTLVQLRIGSLDPPAMEAALAGIMK